MENQQPKTKRLGQRDRHDIAFIAVMSILPLLQFAIFYVYVNVNSVVMSFQTYDSMSGGYVWYGLENFKRAWSMFTVDKVLLVALKNSAIYFVVNIVVGSTLTLLFSYYIYKKRKLHNLFKITLFLPSVISAIVMILLFKYFVDYAVPNVLERMLHIQVSGLASSKTTQFGTVLFYAVWSGFGTGILMYSGAMNNISESVVEAAHLDGATMMQEFWYITVPMVYPTISTFLTVAVAGFFTADMGLYSFFGNAAERYVWTTGYFLLKHTQEAQYMEYPFLACLGVIYTLVTLPFTFGARKLLNRFNPMRSE